MTLDATNSFIKFRRRSVRSVAVSKGVKVDMCRAK